MNGSCIFFRKPIQWMMKLIWYPKLRMWSNRFTPSHSPWSRNHHPNDWQNLKVADSYASYAEARKPSFFTRTLMAVPVRCQSFKNSSWNRPRHSTALFKYNSHLEMLHEISTTLPAGAKVGPDHPSVHLRRSSLQFLDPIFHSGGVHSVISPIFPDCQGRNLEAIQEF